MKQKKVAVIGAGASGLTAAVYAARGGCQVTVIEANDRIGKKILVTGNGRCNYTNRKMDLSCFRSDCMKAADAVVTQFSWEDTVAFFRELGIEPAEKNGYFYPLSGQASCVPKVFEMELKSLGVRTLLSEKVISVKKRGAEFVIQTLSQKEEKKDREKSLKEQFPVQREYRADAVILASGSLAGLNPKKAADGYGIAEGFGHTLTRLTPALTGMSCAGNWWKGWTGVRQDGRICLKVDGKPAAEDRGELQLTAYGISGIPVFQVSRFASKALPGKKVTAELDFFPDFSTENLTALLRGRMSRHPDRPLKEHLTGLLPDRLAEVLISGAEKENAGRKKMDWREQAAFYKQVPLIVTQVNPMEQAQVCAGGVRLEEINPATMESRLIKGFYLTGELLDADGICGGYNLQWAWATGSLAGKSVSV